MLTGEAWLPNVLFAIASIRKVTCGEDSPLTASALRGLGEALKRRSDMSTILDSRTWHWPQNLVFLDISLICITVWLTVWLITILYYIDSDYIVYDMWWYVRKITVFAFVLSTRPGLNWFQVACLQLLPARFDLLVLQFARSCAWRGDYCSFQEEWIPRSHLSFSLDCYGFVQSYLELCLIGHSAQSVGMMWVACHDMSALESRICLSLTCQKMSEVFDWFILMWFLSQRQV